MSQTWVAAAPWIVVLLLVIAVFIAWFLINCSEEEQEPDGEGGWCDRGRRG